MFKVDSADMCAGKFLLVSMGGRANPSSVCRRGTRTPIGASGNFLRLKDQKKYEGLKQSDLFNYYKKYVFHSRHNKSIFATIGHFAQETGNHRIVNIFLEFFKQLPLACCWTQSLSSWSSCWKRLRIRRRKWPRRPSGRRTWHTWTCRTWLMMSGHSVPSPSSLA